MTIRKVYVEIPGAMIVTDRAGTHVVPEEPAAANPAAEEVAVPYTKKQKRLLKARAHGWKPTGKAKGLAKVSKRKAAKMAKEPTKRKAAKGRKKR